MNYFNLFSNIFINKGVGRILINDLQRNEVELFPLELNNIIEDLNKNSIEDTINLYDKESQKFVKEYIAILLDKEYGFITKDNWDKNFPSLSYQFYTPNIITNAYLEIDNISTLSKVNQSLSNLGTEYIVIHYNNVLTVSDIKFIEQIFKNSSVTSIELISQYKEFHNELFFEEIEDFCERIYSFSFYDCNKIPFKIKDKYKFTISFVKEKINKNSCGKVDLQYFNTNLPKVLEAINYNSCLYKKIAIDINGNIKNCPAMCKSYGNIKDTRLEEALQHKDFKKYWSLTKDNIEVCKDCEFRYICTDCRAFTEQSHSSNDGLDISKPLKCGYDPHTGKWQEWSTNPLKQRAIKYYGI